MPVYSHGRMYEGKTYTKARPQLQTRLVSNDEKDAPRVRRKSWSPFGKVVTGVEIFHRLTSHCVCLQVTAGGPVALKEIAPRQVPIEQLVRSPVLRECSDSLLACRFRVHYTEAPLPGVK